jgi:hypothetical protein
MELKIQADLSIVHQCACGWIFLHVGFNRIIGIDYVTCRAEGTGTKTDVSRRRSETEGRTCRAEEIEGGSSAPGDENSS